MSIINSQPLIGASGQGGGYNLTNSLRFRASASAYLNRTLGSSGSLRAWTWSAWVKRGTLGVQQDLFGWVDLSGGNFQQVIGFNSDNTLEFQMYNSALGGYVNRKTTTQVFRDPAAWYHIVVTWDSNNATADDRARIYINGTRVTAWANNTNPSINQDSYINNSSYPLGIGRCMPSSSNYFDGYLAEVNFIDGQALTPSSFGSFNALTGVWQPARYTGTYGTNGFYLPFTDNSALTTSSNVGLGRDYSGNGNYWTTNNISITAGTTYDSMTDVPTLTSATTANYCVMNPLTTGSFTTLSAANLNTLGNTSSNNGNSRSTFAMQTGKWYFETTLTANALSTYPQLGIMTTADGNRPNNGYPQAGYSNSSVNPSQSVIYMANGQKQISDTASSYGSSFTNGDVIGIAIDSDNGAIYFAKNGTWQNSGVPTSGSSKTGAALTWTGGTVEHLFSIADYNGTATATNFGQRPFAYTPPTGFVALNTFNLPSSTIVAGNKQMDVSLYSGNNSTPRSITGLNFQPDFVWIKDRSNAYNHTLWDVVRGVGSTKGLSSNSTDPEGLGVALGSTAANGYVSALNSNGFEVTSGSSTNVYVNTSPDSYVGWQWKAGGTAVTNTAGTISAQVSANPTAGFSVVTWSASNISSPRTIGHGLGVAPSLIIVKPRSYAGGWYVYHSALGETKFIELQSTGASTTSSTVWNNTAPTSSVFTVGSTYFPDATNSTYVSYCFAPIAGYSAFGNYTGNGSADGPFVFTGFRPRFILIKITSTTGSWTIVDTARDSFNLATKGLYPDLAQAEDTSRTIDILSNGFKFRSAANNISSATFIYMAFAENPFKNSLAR